MPLLRFLESSPVNMAEVSYEEQHASVPTSLRQKILKMRLFGLWTITTLLFSLSQAQNTNTYTSDSSLTRAFSAFGTLQKFYSPSTGLYTSTSPDASCPSCWWQTASTLTTLSNLLLLAPSLGPQISPILQNTFSLDANSSGASNWLSGNYDDVAWWGLAWIAAYDATGQQQYLETAEAIFEYLKGTWGTHCGGGGMWWSEKKTYVNAITNELVICLAAKLANRMSEGEDEEYGDWAEMAWTWFAGPCARKKICLPIWYLIVQTI